MEPAAAIDRFQARFLSSSGRLIHGTFAVPAAIPKCSENYTEIYFPRATSGDGARVDDRITVKMSRMNGSAKVMTEIDRTAYIVFLPVKRSISYVAEFRLHE